MTKTISHERTLRGDGFYRFSVRSLFDLLCSMPDEGLFALEKMGNDKIPSHYRDPIKFLCAAELMSTSGSIATLTKNGLLTKRAVHRVDYEAIVAQFYRVTSFSRWVDYLQSSPPGDPVSMTSLPARAETPYRRLAETLCIGATIAGKGFYPTPMICDVVEFTEIALKRFTNLDREDGYVSTGEWIEALILEGIHPVRARALLGEAQIRGHLLAYTEGSTLNTRHDKHAIYILGQNRTADPVEIAYLYRGDFLTPDKSTSSISLQRTSS